MVGSVGVGNSTEICCCDGVQSTILVLWTEPPWSLTLRMTRVTEGSHAVESVQSTSLLFMKVDGVCIVYEYVT